MSSASIEGVLPTAGMSVISGVVIRPSGRTWTFRAQFRIAPDEDRQLVERADHIFLARSFLHRHERGGWQLRPADSAGTAGQHQAQHGAAGKQAGKTVDRHRTVPFQAPRRKPGLPSPGSDWQFSLRYR
jgi:hypothetical protein